jgi:hypothetical protein
MVFFMEVLPAVSAIQIPCAYTPALPAILIIRAPVAVIDLNSC